MDIIYAEGYNAFLNGKSIHDCPYDYWDLVRHWEWGWECAQTSRKLGII